MEPGTGCGENGSVMFVLSNGAVAPSFLPMPTYPIYHPPIPQPKFIFYHQLSILTSSKYIPSPPSHPPHPNHSLKITTLSLKRKGFVIHNQFTSIGYRGLGTFMVLNLKSRFLTLQACSRNLPFQSWTGGFSFPKVSRNSILIQNSV